MRTSKTMKLVNKFVACLLMVTMLFGIASPMRDVQAADVQESGALTIEAGYLSGAYAWGYACVQFKAANIGTQSESLTLTPDGGDITWYGESLFDKPYDGDASTPWDKFSLFADGRFEINNLDHITRTNSAGTSVGFGKYDCLIIEGQFKTTDEQLINFEKTVFQYIGSNKWRIYTETVNSGALNLADSSLNGTVAWSYGCITFYSSEGHAPAPLGEATQVLTSTGGTLIKRSSATSAPELLTSFGLKGGNTSRTGTFSIDGIGDPAVGTIFTLEGTFETEDGFSINFEKTSFQKATDNGAYDTWVLYTGDLYTPVIDCGVIKPINDGAITSSVFKFDVSNEGTIFGTAGKEIKLRAYNGSGTILKNGAVQTNPGAVDFVYGSDGYCAVWGISGTLGMTVTIEGQFSLSNDPTKVINFPKTVFEVVRGNDAGTSIWVVAQTTGVSSEDYIASGAVSLNNASASSMYAQSHMIYFDTEDISLPAAGAAPYNYMLAEPGESYITYQNPNQEVLDLTHRNNILYSRSSGGYYIYFEHVSQAVNGTIVNLQGKFAMPDGSIGIDIQPVTFMYVLEEGATNGYWVTVGTSFTSDVYWEAANAYEEEILAFEATIRLPQNATENGGVILGTNRDGEDTYAFGVDAAGKPYLSLKDSAASGAETFTFDTNVCTGTWVNIKIVRDKAAQTVNCYIDNAETPITLSAENDVEIKPTAKTTVGGDYTQYNANFFKGSIKDVTLYADVDGTQVIASYDLSVVASTTNTIADGNDSKAYELTRSLRWLDPDEVSAPTNYAYSFAVVGDTQAINDKNGNKNDQLQKIYDYIVQNEDEHKIKFVFGLGDITENNDTSEWDRAKEQIQKLDEAGIPYNLNRGNHEGVLQGTDSTLMNTYFPYENYKNKWNVYYDGKIENSCQKLTVGSVDYLIFALDYNPSDAVLNWAGSIIESHPNYNVIITTHGYMTSKKEYTGDTDGDGARIWENLIKKYSNIVLVLSGHVYANDIAWNQVTGDNGNKVTQMVVNPQVADAMTSGGTGMVAMLYFSEDGKNVQVRYYSTVRNQYLADTNQFSLELNVVEHVDAVTVKPYTNVKTTYRSTDVYTYPTLEGYLFAGWFTDEACTKESALAKDAVVDDTTTYYAKFVDENVLTVKRQISEGTTTASTTTNLRLVTSVDSLLYEGVGFNVGFNDGELKQLDPITTVYASLFASGAKYRPDVISAASNYFTVLNIAGIPEALISANVNVEVQPYWITLDGTTVVGTSVTKKLIPTE